MPATSWQRRRSYARVNMPWRLLLKNRTVRRRVQGVDLSFRGATGCPTTPASATYGQNLVSWPGRSPSGSRRIQVTLPVLDIGANVGDSAAQILAAVDAMVLCVEGDPYWVSYLRQNLGGHQRVTMEEVLLMPDDSRVRRGQRRPLRGARRASSPTDEPRSPQPTMSVRALAPLPPGLRRLRLVKSDTDGFDTQLVPPWPGHGADAAPVSSSSSTPCLSKRPATS